MASKKNLLFGGLLFGVVAAFLLALLTLLAAPDFSEPMASQACSGGKALTSSLQEYSYKPGQRGVEAQYLCCGPGGDCDVVTEGVLFIFFLVALFPACLVGLGLVFACAALAKRHGYRPVLWSGVAVGVILSVLLAIY